MRHWIVGLGWLLAYWAGGVSLAWALPLPFPVALWGLLLALMHFFWVGRVPPAIRVWAQLATLGMPMLFVPSILGLWVYRAVLTTDGLMVLLVIVLSTVITLLVPAFVYKYWAES